MVNASMAAAGAATTAAICVALLSSAPNAAVESRGLPSNLFGVAPGSPSHHRSMTRNTARPLGEALLSSVPRGGDEADEEEEEAKPLYFPELVTTTVVSKSRREPLPTTPSR